MERVRAEMAVFVSTGEGNALLKAIFKAIDDKKVVTWGYTQVGAVKYFTHTATQWDQKAWFQPSFQSDGLRFYIVPPQGKSVSREAYAIYHGRLVEMLLAHFDSKFSD